MRASTYSITCERSISIYHTPLRAWKVTRCYLLAGSPSQWQCAVYVRALCTRVVQALGETISAPIISSVCQSPFFAVCIDETTDVSVKKELIIYIRYICKGEIKKTALSGSLNSQMALPIQLLKLCVPCAEKWVLTCSVSVA